MIWYCPLRLGQIIDRQKILHKLVEIQLYAQ